MGNRATIYKPSIDYHYTNKKNYKKTMSLSEKIKTSIENLFFLILAILFFVLNVGLAYNIYNLTKLKIKKISLLKENETLKKEYQYLTSKEFVLEKAKKLNLRPPRREDLIELR